MKGRKPEAAKEIGEDFMEFFKISQIAETFLSPSDWRQAFYYGGAFFLVLFAFQAIALYTVAKKAGYKHRWMAFVPFFSTYYIGVCGQKNKSLGMSAKLVGILAACMEVLLCAGFTLHYVGYSFAEPYIEYEQVPIYGIPFLQPMPIKLPDDKLYLSWAVFCFETLLTILEWVQLIYIFLQVMLVSAFFQTYAARRYFLFTVCSVLFPIQGILFFVVRNNAGMSYRDYIRLEQERRYRIYRQYNEQNNMYSQNGYNAPPRGGYNDGYGNGYADNRNRPENNDDPFGEFGNGHDDDPFK